MKKRWFTKAVSLFCVAAMLGSAMAGCSGESSDTTSDAQGSSTQTESSSAAEGEPVYGGTLNIAVGSVTSLDGVFESADEPMSRHIFETVLSLDENYTPQTGVCSYKLSDDYLTIYLTVRDGVKFHNGDAVTAEDIKASLERWIANSDNGKNYVGKYLNEIVVTGDNTLEMHFNTVASAALGAMGNPYLGPFVMPASICEKYPDTAVSEDEDLIGTGPYKFTEWVRDNYVRVDRYEDYVDAGNDCGGTAGKKNAYVDTINFYFCTDVDAEVNGVLSGTYDLAENVNYSVYLAQKDSGTVNFELINDGTRAAMVMDKSEGWTANKTFRQAVQACLDDNAIMKSAFGTEELYTLDGSWYYDIQPEDGLYNQANVEKAKELLKECGYDGSELVYLTQESGYYYTTAYMAVEQMKQAGINVTLKIVDQAQLYSLRNDPKNFDFFAVGFTNKADPSMMAFLADDWPGLWVSEKKTELMDQMAATMDLDEKKAIWKDMTDLIYDEVPVISFGTRANCTITTTRIHNATYDGAEPYYWNIWISE